MRNSSGPGPDDQADLLRIVQHIESELARLGRLVATLRARVEGAPSSSPSQGSTIDALRDSRTRLGGSPLPFPSAAPDEAVPAVERDGTSYGFVRRDVVKRALEDEQPWTPRRR